jgi:tetratricopeptide (TPR) repeat protein
MPANDWESVALSQVGLGNVSYQAGNVPEARTRYETAIRTAAAHGLASVEGIARHWMMVAAFENDDFTTAELYAVEALRAYGEDRTACFRLAADVAAMRMLQGQFASALRLFHLVLPEHRARRERMTLWANICRAAGGCGDVEEFDRAWDHAWASIALVDSREEAAQAMLDMAHGASSLQDWERASVAAQNAYELSHSRGEGRVEIEAEAMMEKVRVGRGRSLAPRPTPAASSSDHLVNDLVGLISLPSRALRN